MAGRRRRRPVANIPTATATRTAVGYAYQDLAVHVRRLRLQHGFSQRALALRMGTNERAIRRIEKRQHNVTLEVLVRLAEALDVGVQALLAPVSNPTADEEYPAMDGRITRAQARVRNRAL
jgi:transcriptional regulator with XRE-family HTH domain